MHNSKVIFKPELIAQLNVSLVYSLKLCKLDQKYCELVILSVFFYRQNLDLNIPLFCY
jgi:hypothetical protein